MFAMVFRTQWAWTRTSVTGFAALAFVFPAIAWRLASAAARGPDALQVMDGFAALGPMLGFLALFGPFILASLPWGIDHETKHVYPLSLPISWQRWVGMRFAVGAITLLIPALALYAGAKLTLGMIEMPPLLRGYAGALALRFLLASLVAYGLTFALQYLAGRRAALVALIILLSAAGLVIALALLGMSDVAEAIGRAVFQWPGPLAIFVEPWTLIDV
jgi:hypothetical protein